MNWIEEAKKSSKNYFSGLASVLYPDGCVLCGLDETPAVCDACEGEMKQAKRLQGGEPDCTVLGFHYSGRAGQAVRLLKYGRSTALADFMALRLKDLYEGHFDGLVDVIVPVPIHWSRRADRGFNQSELLCERLPRQLVRPEALKRIRRTKAQASLTPRQRLTSLTGAFEAASWVRGQRVLLVDDVVTSGATLDECCKALKSAGAQSVSAMTFAGSP